MPTAGDFWRGRRVLVTGHTGFKGAWLTLLLARLGATVGGWSLPVPVSEPALFDAARLAELCEDARGDIGDLAGFRARMEAFAPDTLFHMAAQPIVRAGVEDPIGTLDVNVMGTAKVLQAARDLPGLRTVVVVTSDKCYENRERVWPYREDEAMGGADPYSASKGAAELVAAAFARTYFAGGPTRVVSVRAGNVIGGGDWAADRLLPDLVRAALSGRTVSIRSPGAVRPWQHVLDPLLGYMTAARHAATAAGPTAFDAWNFGPNPGEELTVREVVEAFREAWGDRLAVDYASAPRVGEKQEAGILRVDSTKAKVQLGWAPRLSNRAAIAAAAAWYKAHAQGGDARALTQGQIETLLNLETDG